MSDYQDLSLREVVGLFPGLLRGEGIALSLPPLDSCLVVSVPEGRAPDGGDLWWAYFEKRPEAERWVREAKKQGRPPDWKRDGDYLRPG